MSISMPIQLGLGIAALIASLLLLVLSIKHRRKLFNQGRLDSLNTKQKPAKRFRSLGSFLRPSDEAELKQLMTRAIRAGLYSREAVDLFLTIRVVLLFVAAGGVVFILSMVKNFGGALFLMAVLFGGAVGTPG